MGRANAGKTTYSYELARKITKQTVILDADEVRPFFNDDFSDEGRENHIRRLAKFACIINKQGTDVIVSAVTPKQKWRDMAFEIMGKRNCKFILVEGGFLWEGTEFEPVSDNFDHTVIEGNMLNEDK